MDEEYLAALDQHIERAESQLRSYGHMLVRLMDEGRDTELAQRSLQAYLGIVLKLHQQRDIIIKRLCERPVIVV